MLLKRANHPKRMFLKGSLKDELPLRELVNTLFLMGVFFHLNIIKKTPLEMTIHPLRVFLGSTTTAWSNFRAFRDFRMHY